MSAARWYDDPELREVWTEDEGDYLEELRQRNDALFAYIRSLPSTYRRCSDTGEPYPEDVDDEARTDALIEEAVHLDLAALEQWCEQRDAADPYNVLVEE